MVREFLSKKKKRTSLTHVTNVGFNSGAKDLFLLSHVLNTDNTLHASQFVYGTLGYRDIFNPRKFNFTGQFLHDSKPSKIRGFSVGTNKNNKNGKRN